MNKPINKSIKVISKFVILLLLALATACSRSQPSQYFILNNSSHVEPSNVESSSVEIKNNFTEKKVFILGPIFMPDYLRKQEIVERQESHLLKISENKLWAEPLGEGIQRLLISEMNNSCGAVGTIHTYSTKKSEDKKHFKIHIESFEKNLETDFVEFSGRYYLNDFKAIAKHFDIETRCDKENTEPAKCMSAAIADLANEFCEQL